MVFGGAKASITSKSIKNGTWMGANFLGKILAETRNELRRSTDFSMFLNAPQPDPTADLIANSSSSIITHLLVQINRAKSTIINAFPDVKVAVGGIIGISLNAYNRLPGTSSLQPIVDEAIVGINAQIHQMNSDSRLPHPRLTSKVHIWKNGIRKSKYDRLYDGLHPSDLVLRAWGRQLSVLCTELELFSFL